MRARLSGFRTRLILTYLVIFLVSAAIMAGRAGSEFAKMTLENTEHDLEIQAFVMASALAHPAVLLGSDNGSLFAIPGLQTLTGNLAQDVNSQLTILDPLGNIIATSLKSIPANQSDQPEVVAAINGQLQHDIRFDSIAGQTMIYAAAPVRSGGQLYGVVQISIPLAEVTARTERFWFSLGLTALLAAAVATLAGWWLAGQLVRPVRHLRDAATRLAAGSLDERVPVQGVTEIVQLAEAFNHMAERIQAMISAQRVFVANASHELRTPLTSIKLRAEALGNGALQDPTVARKFVQEIEGEADRLGRMAGDLLTLSQQDAAPPLARAPVDLAALISTVTAEMALRAEKSHVTLVRDVAPDLPMLSADPAGLRTVLVNLLDNALQYTPAGGTITVTARASVERPGIMLQVADSGVGIPAKDLPHIFERYYRADKARSRRTAVLGSGAGLGLSIVSGIIEDHGGTISAASTPGQGTTMTITLPL
jgi:signal transduction histidine kinase